VRLAGGWPAVISLAAASPVPGRSDHHIADYLNEEVIDGLAPGTRRFLVRTSILSRLWAPLCEAVLPGTSAGVLLRQVAATGAPISRRDGPEDRLRLAPPLRGALLVRLRREEPGLEAVLHSRASRWLEENGDRWAAIRHARGAGETDRAGELILAGVPALLGRGAVAPLGRWLREPDERRARTSPCLALAWAWLRAARGEASARHWILVAGDLVGDADEAPSALGAPLDLLRAVVADEPEAMLRDAESAAGRARGGPWAALSALALGIARDLSGDRESARWSLRQAVDLVGPDGPAVRAVSLARRALMAAADDDWTAASGLADRARRLAGPRGDRHGLVAALVLPACLLVAARLRRPEDGRAASRAAASIAELSPGLARDAEAIVARAEALRAARPRGRNPAPRLTAAEARVLAFLPTHLSVPEIAARLVVSRFTVKTQAAAVYRKLGASSRAEAVDLARGLGLLADGL
jgi:LuxR family maltose regulon positive regulatory protein